jgi:ribosomal-protein-alanine N-acetyltransferase
VKVRPATAADLPAMLDLERQCPAAAHWSPQKYDDLFRTLEGGSRRFVLVLDESAEGSKRGPESQLESAPSRAVLRTLGFLIAHHVHPEWELENLVVAPAFRRRGLATRLLTALLLHARETNSQSVFLEVRESNQEARALYIRAGFEESGRRRLYYTNPQEDAVLYSLVLTHRSTNHHHSG